MKEKLNRPPDTFRIPLSTFLLSLLACRLPLLFICQPPTPRTACTLSRCILFPSPSRPTQSPRSLLMITRIAYKKKRQNFETFGYAYKKNAKFRIHQSIGHVHVRAVKV